MLPLRLLLRAARRLHEAWRDRAVRDTNDPTPMLERLGEHQRQLQQVGRLLDEARGHGWFLVVPHLQAALLGRLKAVQEAAGQARLVLENSPPFISEVVALVADLRQLEDEFGTLELDWKGHAVAVTTEPVTLEGVHLGPFAIRFFWPRLAEHTDVACFDVLALDPNPAAANDLVTHPHVKDDSLCAGDATAPLRKALEQGRLADAFFLIRSVLMHYNVSSPYVPLEDWEGIGCEDCGRTVADDDRCSCDGCDQDFCDECMSSCVACDRSRCFRCLTRCDVCEEHCCSGCLQACAHSGRDCCPGCLQACASCGADVACDELSEESGLCPSCQESPPTPAGDPVSTPTPLTQGSQPLPPENEHADPLESFSPAAG